MKNIAIYDLDRTITRRATYTPFLLHTARTLHPWRLFLIPFVVATIALYALQVIGRATLKEWNQRLLIGSSIAASRLGPVIENFATVTLRDNIAPGALLQIEQDRAAGCWLVLATASYRIYASKIADLLEFDDVIATESVVHPHRGILARIDGDNCYGAAKLAMVRKWLAATGLARDEVRIRFYTDHVSDAPLLDWADEGFAVNAHDRLRKLASLSGWPILNWH